MDIHKASDAAHALLRRKYRHVERVDDPDGVFLSLQKGRFSLFGVYIVHPSILALIAGAMAGSVFGIEGFMNITEGEAVNAISLRSGDQSLPLPFSVHCDKFTVAFALGIVTGSVWAHYAWGSYWSWDPKEIWSLITWLVYAVMLHARFVRGWRGRRMALMSIVGFGCVLFTYLGVNLLPSLHSYMS